MSKDFKEIKLQMEVEDPKVQTMKSLVEVIHN